MLSVICYASTILQPVYSFPMSYDAAFLSYTKSPHLRSLFLGAMLFQISLDI